ncbi:MAG: alpha/beta hydrolase, partial [Myxococcota bacterium]
RGPIERDHGWATYRADQIALADHLGLDRFAVLGMCIGGPYGLALCQALPDRITAAVLFQPLGKGDNQDALDGRFDAWRADIEADHPEADAARWERFRARMFGGEFAFTVSPDGAARIRTPTLLLAGNDLYHPRAVSDALAACLPEVTYVPDWKDDALAAATQDTVRRFVDAHLREG